jgi:hypothetical protein
MKLMKCVVVMIIGAMLSFFVFNGNVAKNQQRFALSELARCKVAIQQHLAQEGGRIVRQLNGFSRAVSANQDFSMKLVVDKDRSAPVVSEIALQYMEPMDLSLLEVVDSSQVLLSCGQFPGANGKTVSPAIAQLDTQAAFLFDDLRGEQVFTHQARVRFSIAETPVFAVGGTVVDQDFLARLAPTDQVRLIVKRGTFVLGTCSVQSMSDLRDNTIIVNDTSYLATSLTLPYSGIDDPPLLYILIPKPVSNSLLKFR